MRDILDFKVMVTPLIAKGVYLLLSAFVIVSSFIQTFKGSFLAWHGHAVPGAVFCAHIL